MFVVEKLTLLLALLSFTRNIIAFVIVAISISLHCAATEGTGRNIEAWVAPAMPSFLLQ